MTASRVEARFVVAESTSLSAEQKRLIAARLGPVVTAVSQESRSQYRNRKLALERLAGRLAHGAAPAAPAAPDRALESGQAAPGRGQAPHLRAQGRERRKPGAGDWD